MIAAVGEGASLLFEGARFLKHHRRLWPLALVPVVFAFVFVAIGVSLFWVQLDWIYSEWTAVLPQLEADVWWSWIWVGPGRVLIALAGFLGVVVAFAATVVASLLIANLAAAPFLDELSLRVELIAAGRVVEIETGFLGKLGGILGSFRAELQRLLLIVSVALPLTAIGFVLPGAHLITGPALILVTILFLPLDYAGFALDRRGIPFSGRRRWLRENRSLMLGFGGVAFLACLVPGLNLLLMPAQVTAGTLLVARRAP